MVADLRALMAQSDEIGRCFADLQDMRSTDFRALLHIMVAETAGQPVSSSELGQRMGLTGGGATYLVDRLTASGHVRRDSDDAGRRKVILRCAEPGLDAARAFFAPLQQHTHAELARLPAGDLAAAHRVFIALTAAMRGFQDELDGPNSWH